MLSKQSHLAIVNSPEALWTRSHSPDQAKMGIILCNKFGLIMVFWYNLNCIDLMNLGITNNNLYTHVPHTSNNNNKPPYTVVSFITFLRKVPTIRPKVFHCGDQMTVGKCHRTLVNISRQIMISILLVLSYIEIFEYSIYCFTIGGRGETERLLIKSHYFRLCKARPPSGARDSHAVINDLLTTDNYSFNVICYNISNGHA